MIEVLLEILSRLRPLKLVRWLAVVGACLLLFILINNQPLREYFTMRDTLDTYRQKNDQLERDRNDLLREEAALQAGGFPAEKAIRERLRMIKPGEKVYFIEDESTTETTTTTEN